MSAPRPTTPHNNVAGADDVGNPWDRIKNGLQKNLTTPISQKPMEAKEYMDYYTAVHKFCLTQKATGDKGGAVLQGETLYASLKNHLFEHVLSIRAKLERCAGEELLRRYVDEWKQFREGAQRNASLLMYLNRHWVLTVLSEGNKKQVYEILPLHTVLWEEVVLDVSQDVVREEVLRTVEKKKKGEGVDEELVRGIVEVSPVDEKDSTKRVPDVYQLLLRNPSDETIDNTDKAIIFHAIRLGYTPTVSYLLNQGLDVNIEDSTGRTPLCHAAETHSTTLTILLLSHNASLNVQDKRGLTPLHWASKTRDALHHHGNEFREIVKLLLENGADPTLKDNDGKTPFALAKEVQYMKEGILALLKEAMEGKGVEV